MKKSKKGQRAAKSSNKPTLQRKHKSGTKKGVDALARAGSARIRHIHARLRKEQNVPADRRAYPNCVSLGKELEVDMRTIARDVDAMRNMGMPVKTSFQHHGYYYDEAVTEFPLMQLSDGELFVLCMARQALAAYRGMALSERLESVFDKLLVALDGELSFDPAKLAKVISFRPSGFETSVDVGVFESVCQALLDDEELKFTHTKVPEGDEEPEAKERHVQPLHLLCWENSWYLYSQDKAQKARRTFALGRMAAVKGTGETFTPPSFEKVQAEVSKGYGIYLDVKPETVRLQFRGKLARLVEERSLHATQKTRWIKSKQGRILELTMEVGHTPEVEARVLSWGSDVKVLEPKALKDAVKRHARQMMEGW